MRFNTFFWILIFLLIASLSIFVTLNIGTLAAAGSSSLGAFTIQVPPGLVLFGLTALLACMFIAFILYLKGSAMLEVLNLSRELQASRALADRAETSRISELHNLLESQSGQQAVLTESTGAAVMDKVEETAASLATRLEEIENSLSAQIGELEDRIGSMQNDRG